MRQQAIPHSPFANKAAHSTILRQQRKTRKGQSSNTIRLRTAPWRYFHCFNPRHDSLATSTLYGRHWENMSRLFLTHFRQFRQFVTNRYWRNNVLENEERRTCWETPTRMVCCWCRAVRLQSRSIWEKIRFNYSARTKIMKTQMDQLLCESDYRYGSRSKSSSSRGCQ